MKRWVGVVLLAGICAIGAATDGMAYNKVWVESVAPAAGATGVVVGVWVVNDVELTAFTLPLEVWDTDGNGSFTAGSGSADFTLTVPAEGRLGASPLQGSITKNEYTINQGTACSGPDNHTFQSTGQCDYISPDAVMAGMISMAGAPDLYYLPPGSDSVAGVFDNWPAEGEQTPYAAGYSFYFTFNVNSVLGTFEIDTCCTRPANHLEGVDLDVVAVPFEFQKGVVDIGGTDVRSFNGDGLVPGSYDLGQNYPNPFNAGTVIRFDVSRYGRVQIDVYNILGRKVKTLVNDDYGPGTYGVDWDGRADNGTTVSTGVYFYSLRTEGYSKTRSMVLLK